MGANLNVEAHRIYSRLAPDGREHAAPLVRTMYRLANIDVAGQARQRRVRAEMEDRVRALHHRLDAEDALQLAAADPTLHDRDDLDAPAAWRAALAEIESKLTIDI